MYFVLWDLEWAEPTTEQQTSFLGGDQTIFFFFWQALFFLQRSDIVFIYFAHI